MMNHLAGTIVVTRMSAGRSTVNDERQRDVHDETDSGDEQHQIRRGPERERAGKQPGGRTDIREEQYVVHEP